MLVAADWRQEILLLQGSPTVRRHGHQEPPMPSSPSSSFRHHYSLADVMSFDLDYLLTGDARFEAHDRVHYTIDQLLQLREVVVVHEEILKVKKEVDTEFFGEDQSWTKVEVNVSA
ncbi:hypothetical protein L2E82_23061 [Cichorium intybus]|uniref:Uncharacterized protein n=1 Tax=Cichorium intybus TaxID=13427 RepID=A0ACB9DZH8_CICIN|nr:hypothetical protein L2E82_23061 [Cichorium intybus]